MNTLTRFGLILLRLAIGWQLLFAGLAKFEPGYRGSEDYLQESCGPLAPLFHRLAGDPLADRFAVRGDGGDGATTSPAQRLPAALDAEWEGYFQRFYDFYGLTEEQKTEARAALDEEKAATTTWLEQSKKEVRKTSPYGPPVIEDLTPQQRVEAYQKQRQKVRDLLATLYPFSLRTIFATPSNADLLAEKRELARMGGDLQRDLDTRTARMKEALRDVLTPEQAEKGRPPEPVRIGWTYMSRMDWIDLLVRWGLVVVGACLLLGLFSRTACLAGAFMVGLFYLAMMPLPGVPLSVRAEGYPYVNKNLVEVIALLTLATTASGRWAGLDALLYWLNPWRKKAPAPGQPPDGGARRGPERGAVPPAPARRSEPIPFQINIPSRKE
jgi:uncharacterized membrane protein YphA (DoxX/SURF4 family)